jgi:hypothetical protein
MHQGHTMSRLASLTESDLNDEQRVVLDAYI